MSSHWRKPDHRIAFLLMFPFIVFITLYPLYSFGERNVNAILISAIGLILCFLWIYAFSYDLEEEKERTYG
jgi:hypothetical protein